MWIIPNTLIIYPFVQDMQALISGSQERFEMCERSLMWKTKPSRAPIWCQRSKKVSSTLRLYSRILKNSLGDDFATLWTSSLEGSLVNHLAKQDADNQTEIQDTSSLILYKGSSTWEDLPLFSLKMLKESSTRPSLKTTHQETSKEPLFSSMSLDSWKAWVTTLLQAYSVRENLAPPINEGVCSLWAVAPIYKIPESDSSQDKYYPRMTRFSPLINYQDNTNGSHPMSSLDLLLWRTPTARDFRGHHLPTMINQSVYNRRGSLPDQLYDHAMIGKANPRWIETLMGLPIGWTMPSCQRPWIVIPMN